MQQQEDGSDGPVTRLRECLQSIEKGGMIEYTVGGHRCQRPPSVTQGKADDQFEVGPDPDNELLWRPNAIQTKQLKAVNLASHFPYTALNDSPLLLVL